MKKASKLLLFTSKEDWAFEHVYEFQPHDHFKISSNESGELSVNIHPEQSPSDNALFSLPVEKSRTKSGVITAYRHEKITEKEKKDLLLHGKLREITAEDDRLPL
ncbi:MAG TPA: hypothetical protein VEC36_11715 [Patescibacteria group bacterium]|nr:hypothetical protein [Patescibacteria group bacterium]